MNLFWEILSGIAFIKFYNNCTKIYGGNSISFYSHQLKFLICIPFPIHCIFIDMEPRSKAGKSSTGKIGTGRETLRLRSKGPATVEEVVC